MKLKNKNYTEKEKQELFKKLKRIGNLFGLKLKLKDSERDNYSGAHIGKSKIDVCCNYNGRLRDKSNITSIMLNNQLTNSVDNISLINKDEYKHFPLLVKIFLHEISHLLTMNQYDVDRYFDELDDFHMTKPFRWTKYAKKKYHDNYRKLPYEKLADNLAYHLLCENYDNIINILLGNRVYIKKEIVSKNLELAKEMKKLYISY